MFNKIMKELVISMGMPNEKDIAFFAVWISRRENGSLTPTWFHLTDEPLTGELRKSIANGLRNLADIIETRSV